jgi:hypothetical protein
MIKTRHQLNPGKNASVAQSIRDIVQEGGVLRLYRGLTAEVVGIMPKSSGMYASYELVRRYLMDDNTSGSMLIATLCNNNATFQNIVASFCGGLFSGIPESIIVTPTQVVKVRLQSREFLGRYKNTIDCFQQVYRQEGILAFSTGLLPTIYRNCVWNSVYFGTMPILKAIVPKPGELLVDSSASSIYYADKVLTLVTGFFGAIFATCINAPLDVVKSRIQSQMSSLGPNDPPLKYRNTLQTLHTIYHDEGLSACYKGFRPKAIRMGLGGAVAMFTFEVVSKLLVIEPTD